MEQFYFEKPSIKRKEEAISYIRELLKYKSEIHGAGGLNKYLDDYEGWLERLEKNRNIIPSEMNVPEVIYFLIRESDEKIVGMSSIRLMLNEGLKRYGGQIGYSIRPTERGKGYNKINLYLCLKECQEYGMDKILLDAYEDNAASWKTMEALGGVNIKNFSGNSKRLVKKYEIDVDKSIKNNSFIYEAMIKNNQDDLTKGKR